MEEPFGTTLDNSTEVTQSLFTTSESNNALSTISTSQAEQTVSGQMAAAVGLVVFGIGALANAGVLAVLIRARRHFGSSVHTLIANQSALDLFTCLVGMGSFLVMITHGFKYNGNRVLDGAICILYSAQASSVLEMTKRMYPSTNNK